jgi:hypothetical protein
MQYLDLSDEEAAALTKELADTGNDRYPFSTPYPDPEGDPGEAATGADPRALRPAEGHTSRRRRQRARTK